MVLLFGLKGLLKSLNWFEYITLFDAEFKKVLYLKCSTEFTQQRRSYSILYLLLFIQAWSFTRLNQYQLKYYLIVNCDLLSREATS